MARKTPVDILPDHSSSDDESEYEEGSTDDEQQEQPQSEEESDDSDCENDDEAMPLVNQPSLQPPQESEDDSYDTQNSPSASAFRVMPIVPKPISQPQTPTSKTINPLEPGKTKVVNRKRPAETETEKIDTKVSLDKGFKGKNVVSGDEDGGKIEKKGIFKWSMANEISLLHEVIDYQENTGNDVKLTMDAFFNGYVKDTILVTLNKSKLYEKIRRLQNKFKKNVAKWQDDVNLSPHEKKLFELSQKIWGSEGTVTQGNGSKVKRGKSDKKDGIVVSNTNTERKSVANREQVEDATMEDFWSMYPLLCASLESEAFGNLTLKFCDSKEYVKMVISGLGEDKARELEDEWKSIHVMDVQLYARRVNLINEQAQATMESLK